MIVFKGISNAELSAELESGSLSESSVCEDGGGAEGERRDGGGEYLYSSNMSDVMYAVPRGGSIHAKIDIKSYNAPRSVRASSTLIISPSLLIDTVARYVCFIPIGPFERQ